MWLSLIGLLVGAALAGASAVIGITIPSAVSSGLDLGNGSVGSAVDCCPTDREAADNGRVSTVENQ